MFSFLKGLSIRRGAWLLFLVSAVVLEIVAAYFQYVLNLQPCVMCIYERVVILGIVFAGLIGLLNPRSIIFRVLGLLIGLYASIRGLLLALKHVDYQVNASPWNVCPALEFNSAFPLNEWFPQFFEAYGACDEIVWTFLSYSAPQWLVVVFGCYIFVISLLLLSQFARTPDKYRRLFNRRF